MDINEIIDDTDNNNYTVADKFTRLANYTIDGLVYTSFIFLYAVVFSDSMMLEGSAFLGVYLLVFYVMFHAIFEHFFQKTPGKFVTRTHVVTKDGKRPSFLNILGRNLGRLIPFNNVSFVFLKSGLHDLASSTQVVHDK